jgi:hypothetical protein
VTTGISGETGSSMFVHPLAATEHQALEDGVRAAGAGEQRPYQILLASARGDSVDLIARSLGCDEQTVRDTIATYNTAGLRAVIPGPGLPPAAPSVYLDAPLPPAATNVVTHIGTGIYARPRRSAWRWWLRIALVVATIILAVGATRVAADYSALDNRLSVHVENQQTLSVDLGTGRARSPFVFGMNVFPAQGTRSADGAYGFMAYDAASLDGMRGAGITMMRFPGGSWGEQHTPSYEQINAFLALAQQTHAEPLMQVRLTGGSPQQAAALVSYCNNPHNPIRQQLYPHAPFVPVHYWVIGNEPDLIGSGYTVASYVKDFIAIATAMKSVDPVIQILGPEVSQYNGPDSAPRDATGTPWLEGFLRGVTAYEHANNAHLLDGVSIHSYPFGTSVVSNDLLLASSSEWRYALPALKDEIHAITGTALPIAITEINTGALGGATASPLATGLWWADTLGILLEEHVQYVDYFAARGLEHPYSALTASGDATPVYRALQLYTHMAPQVIALGGDAGPTSVYAATNAARDTLTLMIVNKSASEVTIAVDPDRVWSGWDSRHIQVPAYALACLVMHRGSAGQLYLYAPSAADLAAGRAGSITLQTLR